MNDITEFRGRNAFLSNMALCTVVYEGLSYPSSENAFQAAKSSVLDERRLISRMTPRESKRYGGYMRKHGVLRKDWYEIRTGVMLDVVRIKFSNQGFGRALVETGDVLLIEGNNWGDDFWGQIIGPNGHLTGQNWLGQILMRVRGELADSL